MRFSVLLPCKRCNASVEVFEHPSLLAHGVICEACLVVESALDAKQQREAARNSAWARICPARFSDTCFCKLPMPERTHRALAWKPKGDGAGLNLWGFPATGKTRSLFLVLMREHFQGASVRVFTAGQFERELETRAFKRAPFVAACCKVDVLAFDDVDKLNMTREMEKTFFGLMDRRMADRKPMLMTHNSTADQLRLTFRYTGEPLVRRIRDFCESVHFPRAGA